MNSKGIDSYFGIFIIISIGIGLVSLIYLVYLPKIEEEANINTNMRINLNTNQAIDTAKACENASDCELMTLCDILECFNKEAPIYFDLYCPEPSTPPDTTDIICICEDRECKVANISIDY